MSRRRAEGGRNPRRGPEPRSAPSGWTGELARFLQVGRLREVPGNEIEIRVAPGFAGRRRGALLVLLAREPSRGRGPPRGWPGRSGHRSGIAASESRVRIARQGKPSEASPRALRDREGRLFRVPPGPTAPVSVPPWPGSITTVSDGRAASPAPERRRWRPRGGRAADLDDDPVRKTAGKRRPSSPSRETRWTRRRQRSGSRNERVVVPALGKRRDDLLPA